MNFESWRDFSLEGEHDLEDAHDRYEKRWMIKENERKAKVTKYRLFFVQVNVREDAKGHQNNGGKGRYGRRRSKILIKG